VTHRLVLFWLCLLACGGFARAQAADALFQATLTGLDGRPVALAQWRGQPLIVNFWARWCAPCRKEIPELIRLRQEYRGRGLEVIGIALEYQAEPVRDFARAYAMTYPVVLAQERGQSLMRTLGNPKMVLPFTIALDRRGKVVWVQMGLMSRRELERAAAAALR